MVHNIAMSEQLKQIVTNYERLKDRIFSLGLIDSQRTALELALDRIEDEKLANAFLNNFAVPFASGDNFKTALDQANGNLKSYDGNGYTEEYISPEERSILTLEKMKLALLELKIASQ